MASLTPACASMLMTWLVLVFLPALDLMSATLSTMATPSSPANQDWSRNMYWDMASTGCHHGDLYNKQRSLYNEQ